MPGTTSLHSISVLIGLHIEPFMVASWEEGLELQFVIRSDPMVIRT